MASRIVLPPVSAASLGNFHFDPLTGIGMPVDHSIAVKALRRPPPANSHLELFRTALDTPSFRLPTVWMASLGAALKRRSEPSPVAAEVLHGPVSSQPKKTPTPDTEQIHLRDPQTWSYPLPGYSPNASSFKVEDWHRFLSGKLAPEVWKTLIADLRHEGGQGDVSGVIQADHKDGKVCLRLLGSGHDLPAHRTNQYIHFEITDGKICITQITGRNSPRAMLALFQNRRVSLKPALLRECACVLLEYQLKGGEVGRFAAISHQDFQERLKKLNFSVFLRTARRFRPELFASGQFEFLLVSHIKVKDVEHISVVPDMSTAPQGPLYQFVSCVAFPDGVLASSVSEKMAGLTRLALFENLTLSLSQGLLAETMAAMFGSCLMEGIESYGRGFRSISEDEYCRRLMKMDLALEWNKMVARRPEVARFFPAWYLRSRWEAAGQVVGIQFKPLAAFHARHHDQTIEFNFVTGHFHLMRVVGSHARLVRPVLSKNSAIKKSLYFNAQAHRTHLQYRRLKTPTPQHLTLKKRKSNRVVRMKGESPISERGWQNVFSEALRNRLKKFTAKYFKTYFSSDPTKTLLRDAYNQALGAFFASPRIIAGDRDQILTHLLYQWRRRDSLGEFCRGYARKRQLSYEEAAQDVYDQIKKFRTDADVAETRIESPFWAGNSSVGAAAPRFMWQSILTDTSKAELLLAASEIYSGYDFASDIELSQSLPEPLFFEALGLLAKRKYDSFLRGEIKTFEDKIELLRLLMGIGNEAKWRGMQFSFGPGMLEALVSVVHDLEAYHSTIFEAFLNGEQWIYQRNKINSDGHIVIDCIPMSRRYCIQSLLQNLSFQQMTALLVSRGPRLES